MEEELKEFREEIEIHKSEIMEHILTSKDSEDIDANFLFHHKKTIGYYELAIKLIKEKLLIGETL